MFKLLLLSVVVAVAVSLPVENLLGDSVLYDAGMFEGDIAGVDPNADRNAIVDITKLWPNGKVYYQISPNAVGIKTVIEEGMKQYKEKTNGCIEFINGKGDGNYVNIYRGNGCWSLVGKQGKNTPQAVSLGSGCQYVGLVVHELGHAIGLWHQQNRSDRDEYLEIHFENISPNMRYNFKKLKPHENFLLVPFDYNSIMQYSEYAFSINKLRTIVPKKPGVNITKVWKRPGLSDTDVLMIKKLYQCDGETRPTPPPIKDLVSDFTEDWGWIRDEQNFEKHFQRVQVDGNWVIQADTANIGEGYVRLITDYVSVLGIHTGCLSYRYKITGSGISYINIQQQDEKTFEIKKEGPFTTASDWKTEKIDISTTQDVRFFVTVASGRNRSGKLYLDDFTYHFGSCS